MGYGRGRHPLLSSFRPVGAALGYPGAALGYPGLGLPSSRGCPWIPKLGAALGYPGLGLPSSRGCPWISRPGYPRDRLREAAVGHPTGRGCPTRPNPSHFPVSRSSGPFLPRIAHSRPLRQDRSPPPANRSPRIRPRSHRLNDMPTLFPHGHVGPTQHRTPHSPQPTRPHPCTEAFHPPTPTIHVSSGNAKTPSLRRANPVRLSQKFRRQRHNHPPNPSNHQQFFCMIPNSLSRWWPQPPLHSFARTPASKNGTLRGPSGNSARTARHGPSSRPSTHHPLRRKGSPPPSLRKHR